MMLLHHPGSKRSNTFVNEALKLSCPLCGMIHSSKEEIDQLERHKITDSRRYAELRRQAAGERP
ncbi:MAG: hypothetical protein CSA21_03245 [Deltaproteobacteria bacterium]|nr:MAG: hypothetical protein CSA21_03245 [Deltaproteobacteria bacterium]